MDQNIHYSVWKAKVISFDLISGSVCDTEGFAVSEGYFICPQYTGSGSCHHKGLPEQHSWTAPCGPCNIWLHVNLLLYIQDSSGLAHHRRHLLAEASSSHIVHTGSIRMELEAIRQAL